MKPCFQRLSASSRCNLVRDDGIAENYPHRCIALETGVYEGQDSDSGITGWLLRRGDFYSHHDQSQEGYSSHHVSGKKNLRGGQRTYQCGAKSMRTWSFDWWWSPRRHTLLSPSLQRTTWNRKRLRIMLLSSPIGGSQMWLQEAQGAKFVCLKVFEFRALPSLKTMLQWFRGSRQVRGSTLRPSLLCVLAGKVREGRVNTEHWLLWSF